MYLVYRYRSLELLNPYIYTNISNCNNNIWEKYRVG